MYALFPMLQNMLKLPFEVKWFHLLKFQPTQCILIKCYDLPMKLRNKTAHREDLISSQRKTHSNDIMLGNRETKMAKVN